MNSLQPNFISSTGVRALYSVAAAAVGFALFLAFDGLRDWRMKRRIAKLCAERRRALNNNHPVVVLPSTTNTPPIEFVATTCLQCAGHLVIPESLRFAEMTCPQCNGRIDAENVKPVTIERSVRTSAVAG